MPGYRKRSYRIRSYGRRSYGGRKFSRYNTYRKRSSKAQAYQIYSLNKKINRVYKTVKPETQTYFSSDVVMNGTIESTGTTTGTYGITELITHKLGCFNGRYARLKSFKLWGMLENNGTGGQEPTFSNTIGLRIVLFSLKSEKYGTTAATDIIANLANSSSFTNDYYMTAPLAPGFSTRYRLLKDKRIYLKPGYGTTKPVSIKMKYPRSLCCSTGMANTSSLFYPKNSVLAVWYLCNMATTLSKNGTDFGLSLKVAYMDDNYTVSNSKNTQNKEEDQDEDQDEDTEEDKEEYTERDYDGRNAPGLIEKINN